MTYYKTRLADYGLSPDAPILNFKWTDLDLGGAGQTCKYFEEHEEGIEIFTPTPEGERPYHIIRKKKKFISRIRLENPDPEKGKYKFTASFKKDHEADIRTSWIFLPPLVYQAVIKEERLSTLYIVEGEFKAFIANHWGLPFIGIPGIHNFRANSKGALNEAIVTIIQKCDVENVVIFYDSDLLELSSKLGKNEKSADARPRSFMRSAENFRRLLLKQNVNIFLGHIKPDPDQKLGIDDLFKTREKESKKAFEKRNKETAGRLLDTFEKAFTGQPAPESEFIIIDITQARGYDPETKSSYLKTRRIFKLETYSKFYEYHKTRQLAGFDSFRFNKILYDIKEGFPILHDDQTKLRNPIQQIGNAYFCPKADHRLEQISDFVIKLEYVLFVGPSDTRRICSITNTHNTTWFTEMKIQDFASPAGFMNKIAARPRFTWFGTSKQLLFVKSLVEYDNSVISARMINRLGWQPAEKVWAWSNGITKEDQFLPANLDGLVSIDGKGFFLPACSRLEALADDHANDSWFCNLDNYKEEEDPLTLTQWAQKMSAVFDTKTDPNGTIGVMFGIMSLYSDIVFNTVRFNPLLYLSGIPQSGKNTLGQAVMALFGRYTPPPNIHNTTGTALNRICSHIFNGIIWFDEYKNDLPKWKQELIKSAFDRTGKATGTFSNDDRIKRVKYNSPVIVSGQDIPGTGGSDPALANRGALCHFRVTERTEAAKERRADLLKYEELGLTHITAELLTYRAEIETSFAATFTAVSSQIRRGAEEIDPKVSARLIEVYSCILSPAICLIEKGKIDIGKTPEELIKIAVNKVIDQNRLSEENSEQSQFWSILETLIYLNDEKNLDNAREGYEYKINGPELLLRMSKIYDRYARYGRRNNKIVLDQQTLTSYLKNHPAYKGTKRSVYYKDKTTGSGIVFSRHNLPEASNIMTSTEARDLAKKHSNEPEINIPPSTNSALLKGEYEAQRIAKA